MKNNSKFKQIEIGPIPEEWEVSTLEGLITLVIDHRGLTPKKLGGDWSTAGIQAISAKNIKDGCLVNLDEFKFVDELLYKKWMPVVLKGGDILLTSEAPLGEVYFVKGGERFCLSQRLFALRVKKEVIDPGYLFYWFRSSDGQQELQGRATGSVVQGIRQSELLKVVVSFPPLPEQSRIASILSSLDDKIELNRKMNANLEQIASALFKRWFVDFEFPNAEGKSYKSSGGRMVESELGEIPEGWRVGRLGDEFVIIMGQSPSGDTYNEAGEGVPFYQGRTDFGFRFPVQRIFCTAPQRMAKKLDTLISVRAPVGDVNMACEDCCIGRGVGAIRKEGFSGYTLYMIKSLQEQISQFDSEGTVFGSINKNALANIACIAPTAKLIVEFEKMVSCVDEQIFDFSKEITGLIEMRSFLLPRLMSGRIRVKV